MMELEYWMPERMRKEILLREGMDIHAFGKISDDGKFQEACRTYKARLKGDDDALERFGLKNLDIFKGNPEGFIERVSEAESYLGQRSSRRRERRLERNLQNPPEGVRVLFNNGYYAVVTPISAEYSHDAAYLDGGTAPWCISVKGLKVVEVFERYYALGVYYVYSLKTDNSWAIVVDAPSYGRMLCHDWCFYKEFANRENKNHGEDSAQGDAFRAMLEELKAGETELREILLGDLKERGEVGELLNGYISEQFDAMLGEEDAYEYGWNINASLDILKELGKPVDRGFVRSLAFAVDDLGEEQALEIYQSLREGGVDVEAEVEALPEGEREEIEKILP